jgi:hypothetical protein
LTPVTAPPTTPPTTSDAAAVAQEVAALQSAYQSSASTYDAAVDSFIAAPPNISGDTNYDFVVNDEATVFHDANSINDASSQLSIGGLLSLQDTLTTDGVDSSSPGLTYVNTLMGDATTMSTNANQIVLDGTYPGTPTLVQSDIQKVLDDFTVMRKDAANLRSWLGLGPIPAGYEL